MKQKFPLLEAMRAERARREAPIIAPYQAELNVASQMITSLRRRLQSIEQVISRDVWKHVVSAIGHEMSSKLMRLVHEAALKVKGPQEPVRIVLPLDVVRFSDPRSLETEILRQHEMKAMPDLSLRVDEVVADEITVVDVRVPELRFRHALHA